MSGLKEIDTVRRNQSPEEERFIKLAYAVANGVHLSSCKPEIRIRAASLLA